MRENDVSAVVLDAAIEVHRQLGPGLLESVYETCLAYVLRRRGLTVDQQVPIPICFDGIEFEQGFRADLIVNGIVLVELKSVERLARVHRKQVLTYLRLSRIRLGLLVNFGEPLIKDGFHRLANGLVDDGRPISAPPRALREIRVPT
jgi:GxxExxY protein